MTKGHKLFPINKTPTYPNNIPIGLYEFYLARWTSELFGDEHYYDYYHFKPYWNYYMNLQTLLYIQKLQRMITQKQKTITKPPLRISIDDKAVNDDVPAIFRPNDVTLINNHQTNKK